MIDWKEFRKLIGNKKRKYVRGPKAAGKYQFISYNEELKEVTLMHTRATRTLRVFPLRHFIEDFDFIEMTEKKPLF